MLAAVDIQNSILPWSISIFLAFVSVYFCYSIERESNKRQQTEMLLEQERNYISTILDTASALVVMLDPQGRIIEFNRACERTTGYIFAQVKEMYIWDALMIAEEVEILQSALTSVVTERLPITLETQWVTKSGDRRLISWTNTVLCDHVGAVKHVISTGIDISDRTQIEQSLRESEKQYRSVVNNSKEVIFQLDEWGLWTFLNPAWTQITGFSIDESLGTPFSKYIHLDDCPKSLGLFRSLMQREIESCHCEIRYLGKDGRFCWLEVYAQLNLDAYDNIVGISGNLNDVSDRKQTEAALQQVHEEVTQSQKMLRLILDLVPQAIWWKDRDSKFLGCNRNFARLAGVESPSELIGKTDYDFWTKEEADFFRAVDARVMNQNRAEYGIIEPTCLHNSTTTVWLETNKMPLHDAEGRVIGTLGTAQDISDRQHAQEVMQRQLAAMEAATDGIGIVNQSGEYIYVNKAYVEIYGYNSPTELIGKTWREIYYPDEIARFESDISAIIQQNGRWRGEAIAKRKDGSTFFEEVSLSKSENGNLISVCRNISDRKQIEEQIQAALQEKEVLLKEVHHRVKNNLQIIDSLFRHQCRHIKNEQAVQVLKECQNRVVSMSLLHEKLYQSKNLSSIDFVDYVKSLTANLLDSYSNHNNSPHLIIDVERILLDFELALNCGLIINELITNSLKYAFSANVSGEIKISFFVPNNHEYNLIVQDNGVGFPDDFDLEKVKSLGLKLVRSLIRQIDGKIEINNSSGALLKIVFPVKKCDINCQEK